MTGFHIASLCLLCYWLFMSLFAYRNIKSILKKYSNVREVKANQQWTAFIRTDFGQWNQSQIVKGCFLRFPFKCLLLIQLVVGLLLVIYFTKIFGKFGLLLQKAFTKIFSALYLNRIYKIQEKFLDRKISTPIVISNHVNWFDLLYLQALSYPISFVAKADVQKIPILGQIGSYIQCIFVNRSSEKAREDTLNQIQQRVSLFNNQQAYPLIIFPEGTTSNGRSIMNFKIGAFHSLSPITIFAFVYECQQNFQMGMDQILQHEHALLTLCLNCQLTVLKEIISPQPKQTAEEYCLRAQQKLSEMTGFKIYPCGFRQKQEFKKLRFSKEK